MKAAAVPVRPVGTGESTQEAFLAERDRREALADYDKRTPKPRTPYEEALFRSAQTYAIVPRELSREAKFFLRTACANYFLHCNNLINVYKRQGARIWLKPQVKRSMPDWMFFSDIEKMCSWHNAIIGGCEYRTCPYRNECLACGNRFHGVLDTDYLPGSGKPTYVCVIMKEIEEAGIEMSPGAPEVFFKQFFKDKSLWTIWPFGDYVPTVSEAAVASGKEEEDD